jgi:hypothetical protein
MTVLHVTVLYVTVLYMTVLYVTVLHATVLCVPQAQEQEKKMLEKKGIMIDRAFHLYAVIRRASAEVQIVSKTVRKSVRCHWTTFWRQISARPLPFPVLFPSTVLKR